MYQFNHPIPTRHVEGNKQWCLKHLSTGTRLDRRHIYIPDTIHPTIVRLDSGKITGLMMLSSIQGWVAQEVWMVHLDPELRGRGLGKKLYDLFVLELDVLLMSGIKQSQYSRGLWRKFAGDKHYNVWAGDLRHLNSLHDVVVVDGELHCNLRIYSELTPRVRLFMEKV